MQNTTTVWNNTAVTLKCLSALLDSLNWFWLLLLLNNTTGSNSNTAVGRQGTTVSTTPPPATTLRLGISQGTIILLVLCNVAVGQSSFSH